MTSATPAAHPVHPGTPGELPHGRLRLMLVDDEAPARRRLRDLLDDIQIEVPSQIVAEAVDGLDALQQLADPALQVDIALVDIRMPRLDGIALAQQLATRGRAADSADAAAVLPPAIIFVTAYDEYAVQAFELNAIDYLLKPVRASRLASALQKLPHQRLTPASLQPLAPAGRQQLTSSERGRLLLVPLDDILYLRAEQKYVTAHTASRDYLIDDSLTQLEAEFASRFIRIHRNCLVARQAIQGVTRLDKSGSDSGETPWAVLLRGLDAPLPVSRRQWPHLKALLQAP